MSTGLTLAAALVLALSVIPRQQSRLADVAARPAAGADVGRRITRFGMVTGVFNLLWAAVTVLMIVRPGSTTGV